MTDVVGYLERRAQLALGRSLTAIQTESLHKYLRLLIKWQKTQRLIGSAQPSWIVDNVIVDSLLFTRAIPMRISNLCDVGSGAGIPGIPLAIALSGVDVTLIEARQKRASFLAAAIREIPLRNCRLVNRRLDEASAELRGRFDAVVMRCAGNPTAFLPQLSAILAPGALVVASGPPRREQISFGSWLEVDGPDGQRRFWIHHVT